ncbi:hypothetical protein FA95DRAFT_1600107 [Auriscalpium vulgare]|uniref:Uncharacterized protein n=1 Tax=Auriscalpium vulgare TaxID=40419 RepID=A0ACB8R4L0_9AGAM|nr:hypothetical protein FA95DRAFT_1600107 [Auriscalpium vulgare]
MANLTLPGGSIWYACEALETPAIYALYGDGASPPRAGASSSTVASCRTTGTASGTGKKVRPCVVMNDYNLAGASGSESELSICAMGTFGSVPSTALAQVFQHFLLPIAGEGRLRDAGAGPALCPPFGWKDGCWVVARPYQPPEGTRSFIEPYWTGCAEAVLDAPALADLRRICWVKEEGWKALMYDSAVQQALRDDYEVCDRERRKRARALKRASRAPTDIVLDTIPEAPDADRISNISRNSPTTPTDGWIPVSRKASSRKHVNGSKTSLRTLKRTSDTSLKSRLSVASFRTGARYHRDLS